MHIQYYYVSGAVAYSRANFGQGIGPIMLDDVQCNLLDHRRLLSCPHRGLQQHNCGHSEDAGVSCCVEGSYSYILTSVHNIQTAC